MGSNIARGQSLDWVWVEVRLEDAKAALVAGELLAACKQLRECLSLEGCDAGPEIDAIIAKAEEPDA